MVVCRHLGCNAVCRFPLTSDEIIWSEPTFSIHCRGYETLLAECSIRYVDHCRHYVSVGISCSKCVTKCIMQLSKYMHNKQYHLKIS